MTRALLILTLLLHCCVLISSQQEVCRCSSRANELALDLDSRIARLQHEIDALIGMMGPSSEWTQKMEKSRASILRIVRGYQGIKAGCPEGWKFFQGTMACFKDVHGDFMYHEAKETCEKDGASLASITGPGETNFVNELFGNDEMYWIGLRRNEGQWTWEDGTPVKYTNWRPSEPNHCCGNPPDCVMVNARGPGYGQWDDGSCINRREGPRIHQSFVCKMPPTTKADES